MSRLDPERSPMSLDTSFEEEGPVARRNPFQIVTTSGVTVRVAPPPPPEPEPEPKGWLPEERVVIRPPEKALQERDRLLRLLVDEHGEWIRLKLLRHVGKEIPEESVKDLRQRVLLILGAQLERVGPPEHVRAFLAQVIQNVIRNHRRLKRPVVDREADTDEAITSAPDPEEALELVERWARLMRYIGDLPDAEAEVIRCVDLDGMTVDDTAKLLKRPRGTVSTQLTRARERIEGFAQDSNQGGARLGRAR